MTILIAAGLLLPGPGSLLAADAGKAAVPASAQAPPASTLEAPAPQLSIAREKTGFALALLKDLAAEGKSNVAVSPFGVAEVLAVLDLGADTALKTAIAQTLRGSTKGEAATIDGLRQDARLMAVIAGDPKGPFATADGLFVDEKLTLVHGIADKVKAEAGIAITPLDFASPEAVRAVDAWASEHTHGRITSIMQPGVSPSLVAVNALVFKDNWRSKFDPAETRPKPFTRLDGSKVDRPMMALDAQDLSFAAKEPFFAVELPYHDDRFVMTVVTTTKGPAAPGAFATPAAGDLLAGVGLKPAVVKLALPKFTGTGEHDLLGLLSKLGLAAGLASKTQLSGFAEGLSLSSLQQKTFVAVDESGTEAAAVTAAVATRGLETALGVVTASFDRPFVYALRHRETGSIIMIGYVADPGSEAK